MNSSKLEVITVFDEILDSNCYCLLSSNRRGILIDPNNYIKIEAIMREHKVELQYMILTHEHYDHIAALNQMRAVTDAKVICSEECGRHIQNARDNLSAVFDVQLHFLGNHDYHVEPYICQPPDITFENSLELQWEGMLLNLKRVSGHTRGSSVCRCEDILFSGDSLLKEHDVIIRKRTGSRKDYVEQVIPYLLSLDMDMIVYPGHGDKFLLQERKEYLMNWH